MEPEYNYTGQNPPHTGQPLGTSLGDETETLKYVTTIKASNEEKHVEGDVESRVKRRMGVHNHLGLASYEPQDMDVMNIGDIYLREGVIDAYDDDEFTKQTDIDLMDAYLLKTGKRTFGRANKNNILDKLKTTRQETIGFHEEKLRNSLPIIGRFLG